MVLRVSLAHCFLLDCCRECHRLYIRSHLQASYYCAVIVWYYCYSEHLDPCCIDCDRVAPFGLVDDHLSCAIYSLEPVMFCSLRLDLWLELSWWQVLGKGLALYEVRRTLTVKMSLQSIDVPSTLRLRFWLLLLVTSPGSFVRASLSRRSLVR